jgi:hypothetical protein
MAYAIRRNGIVWIGQVDLMTESVTMDRFETARAAEDQAITLAFNNKGNLYEVFNLESFEKTLTIRFGRE